MNTGLGMRWGCAVFGIAAMATTSVANAEALQQVIEKTLTTNPDMLARQAERRAVDEERDQARSGYLPTVDLRLGAGKERSDNLTTRLQGDDWLTLTRSERSLSLRQMLFDGFGTRSAVAQQTARVDAAAYRVQSSSEEIASRVAEVYLEVLRRQELVRLAQENVKVHEDIMERIMRLASGGAGNRADAVQAEGRLALARSSQVAAEGNLRAGLANYQQVIGMGPEQLSEPEAPDSSLPASLDAGIEIAHAQSPALKTAMAELQASEAQYEYTGAAFMPKVDLELAGTDNDGIDGVRGDNRDITGMLVLRYNLYRGGGDQARRAEAAERRAVTRERLNLTRRQVREEVELSWNAWLTARDRLEHLRKHSESSELVVTAYRQQFLIGKRTLLDVLDSENELFNARSSLVSGEYAVKFGIYRILASMGKLLGTLNITPPPQSQPMTGDI